MRYIRTLKQKILNSIRTWEINMIGLNKLIWFNGFWSGMLITLLAKFLFGDYGYLFIILQSVIIMIIKEFRRLI